MLSGKAGEGDVENNTILCLFSHKCSVQNHAVGLRLMQGLEQAGIELLIDPFLVGDDVQSRIGSLELDAIVFLWSDPLLAMIALLEFDEGRRRSIPVFVAIREGDPITNLNEANLREANVWTPPSEDTSKFADAVASLGRNIRAQVAARRTVQSLLRSGSAREEREAAQRLAVEFDSYLLAENLSLLTDAYEHLTDPTVRYWIAIAVGRAGTVQATEALSRFPKTDHPYALEGVRQAQEMIAQKARQ
jgi:hypothetical protein